MVLTINDIHIIRS